MQKTLPHVISKKEIRSKTGMGYKSLRKYYYTDQFLNKIKVSREEFNQIKTFTSIQTEVIFNSFPEIRVKFEL